MIIFGVVYCGCKKNRGIIELDDKTIYWHQTGLGDVHVVSLAVDHMGNIFAGTVGTPSSIKIHRSTNDGDHWELLNTPDITGYVEKMAIHSNGYIYAAYNNGQNGGLIYSRDTGNSWREADIPGMSITSIVFNSLNHVYISSSRHDESAGRILYSTDHGHSWIDTQWPYLETVRAFAIAPGDELISCAYDSLKRSTNNGKTWHVINDDSLLMGCWDLKVRSEDLFFLSTIRNGIYRSIDAGVTWSGTSLKDIGCAPICITSDDFILTADRNGDGSPRGIFYSTDDGENWTDITYETAGEPIECICKSPNGYILVGTFRYGVLRMDIDILN